LDYAGFKRKARRDEWRAWEYERHSLPAVELSSSIGQAVLPYLVTLERLIKGVALPVYRGSFPSHFSIAFACVSI